MSDDGRLKKAQGDDKTERAMKDREVTQNRELSEAERLEMLIQSFQQTHLPNLPQIEGYHVCWLTTTNSRDTIQSRLSAGYTLVTPDEVPGWESQTLKHGDYAGYVGVNEMVAAKLPMFLYEGLMRKIHGTDVDREEGRLSSVLDVIRDDARSRGLKVFEGEKAG